MTVRGIVLACGNTQLPLITYGDGFEVVQVPERPGKDDVDQHLDRERLIVAGSDADLAAVALRLMRKERLGDTVVGFVPTSPRSAVAALWTLPANPAAAFELALRGDPDPVPLVRDDVGGVLVGLGTLSPVRGVAYADADLALRGQASRIEVTPDPEGGLGLVVRVIHRRLIGSKAKEFRPRAFQLGCLPVAPTLDGVRHPRPMDKWTWYRHTEDMRLVRGL